MKLAPELTFHRDPKWGPVTAQAPVVVEVRQDREKELTCPISSPGRGRVG
jgi:hypothetical protein